MDAAGNTPEVLTNATIIILPVLILVPGSRESDAQLFESCFAKPVLA